MLAFFCCIFAWAAFVSAESELTFKLQELTLSQVDGVIPITNADLSPISHPEREHYTLIALTSTDPQHNCESCIDLEKVLERVVHAYFDDYFWLNYLYFAKIDLADKSNKPVFDFLGLKSVPQVWLIPPSAVADAYGRKERPLDEDGVPIFGKYDMLLEPHAEFPIPDADIDTQVYEFADWLARAVLKRIYLRQDNAMLKFAVTFLATFTAILYLKKRGPSILTNTVSKTLIYKIFTFVILFLILGGYSFTTIQGVPFLAKNDKEEVIYISGGTSYQFGNEIVLVGGHYFLLGAILAFMVYLGKYQVGPGRVIDSEKSKFVLTVGATVALYLAYSSFTSMYLRKDLGYPFTFLKLF